jgi:DNA-binding transcriptional MerR regulator
MGVSHATLRYYEDMGLMEPAVRADNGYRYYAPIQILSFNMLKTLRLLDFPIKEIAELMPQRTPERVLDIIEDEELAITRKLDFLKEALVILHQERNLLYAGLHAKEGEITVQRLKERHISLGPRNDFAKARYETDPMLDFFKGIGLGEDSVFFHVGWYFDKFSDLVAAPERPSRYYTLNPLGNDSQEGGDYLVGYSRGYYGEMKDLPERIQAYASLHGMRPTGPVYCVHLHDELSVQDPTQYLLRLTVPFEKI